MKKTYSLLLLVLVFCTGAFAQPTVLGTQLVNGSYTTYNLNSIGLFKQYRLQAASSAAISTRNWEFASGTAAAPDYTTNWRPNTAGNTLSSNIFIPTSFANGARYNTASGGANGLLPVVTSGNYYTFNVNINAAANNEMELLETSFNPVTITSVSNTTPANASNSVLVTCTVSAAPASGEYVYVRYSTTGYASSALSQFTFTGTTGQALIPCHAGGTVVSYYVMSSNQTATQITTDVGTFGQTANDMATLNLNNNGGANYTYTQGSGTDFGGIYSTPTTCYTTVSAFVTALNLGTVTAPVTMYAIGGSATETATTGGIDITQTGTAANPIIFQKFGTGNYTIQASPALTPGSLNDAIFKLIGADYITIDGFTMQENAANTTTAAATNNMTEWGVALLQASTTDGTQNNTIQNNTITLNRTYTNTFGIYSNAIHTPTAVTGFVDVANATTAPHNANKIYGNTISNVNMGIAFIGSRTAAFQDVGNDIGGNSLTTGNTITNWGGSGASTGYVSNSGTSYCILMNHQTADNISYNTITSAAISGTATSFTGIRKDYTSTAPTGTFTSAITNNTVTMSSGFTSGAFRPISSAGMGVLSTATININNNNILNCVMSGAASTSTFTAIFNSSAPGILSISNNIIRGYTTTEINGGFTGISNSGAVVTTVDINNNQIGNASGGAVTFSAATTGTITGISNTGAASTATINITGNSMQGISCVSSGDFVGITNSGGSGVAINITGNQLGTATGDLITYSAANANGVREIFNNGGTGTCVLTIQNNSIRGIVHTVAATGFHTYISNTATGLASVNINSNSFINLNVNTTGNVTFINDAGGLSATGTSSCSNNAITTAFNKSGAIGNIYVYTSGSNNVNGSTMTETGNNFSNITMSGTGTLFLWQNAAGASAVSGPTATITGNTFSNITGGSGAIIIMAVNVAGPATNCSSNIISNISGTGPITAISIGTVNGQGTHNYASNTISSLTSTGTGGNVFGILGGSASVPILNINNNSITGLSSTGASSFIVGTQITAGATVNINDNTVNSLSASGTISPVVAGIVAGNSPTTVNVFKNKVNSLQASGAITSGGPSVFGIELIGGLTLNAYNNFIADLTAPATSSTDAIQGIRVDNITPLSTNNVYYNSVYINASSSGTNFGTSGIYQSGNATATTGALNLIDNIIVNTSTANGTGLTVAHRRSNILLANYAATSDYNLLYAGTPSATNLIYNDGTNSDQTLAAYQTRVSTRDANSISLMPAFTSATDLHLTTANCGIDGKGTPIAITTDIDAATRDVNAPDIGADEFTATYSGTTLAGVAGTAVCDSKNVSASPTVTTYATSVCDLIAKVLPSGADPVAGRINVCVTRDASQLFFNSQPYVQRHYDLEPVTSNQTTTSATITMYFTDAEFDLYNTTNPPWPKLPTIASGGIASPFIGNLKVTQFHGTPTGGLPTSTPGNYTGPGVLFAAPVIALSGSIWSVTVNIAGFSGFYVHTNPWNAPLPIVVNYLTGRRQGSNHLLNWKVTCASTPRATMTLERSADARNYTGINTITADAARCNSPFDYTDASPLKGMNYYRLKIMDADGRVTYSTTVALLNAVKGFDMVSIAPNPVVADNFKLNVASAQAGKMEISIFDMQGRLMNRQSLNLIAGFNSMPVNVANLSYGTYTIRGGMANDETKIIRFVKQ